MKNDGPSDDEQTSAGILVASAVIVGSILVLMSFADPEAKSLRDWVFRYQTLLTGFFAVGAAYVTVRQMRRSDAESERRHQELARLQVRAEKLKVERMLIPQFGQLRVHYKEVSHVYRSVTDDFIVISYNRDYATMEKAADEMYAVAGDFRLIKEIVTRPHWVAAADLFGGELQYHYDRLTDTLPETLRIFTVLEKYTSAVMERRYGDESWRIEAELPMRRRAVLEAGEAMMVTIGAMDRLFPHLYQLADVYQIEL